MSGKSGVYLVSAKTAGEDGDEKMQDVDLGAQYSSVDSGVELSIPDDKSYSETPFRGMGKEELLRHSSKPFWRRLRMICVGIVVLGWLALIITVVAIVLIYPRCRPAPDRVWWQESVIYRIYVKSFQDSDNDGIGDIKGIESRLDYLSDLGVDTISLSPIFKTSSDLDFDIVNHTVIDLKFGTLEDLCSLITALHSKDMRLLLDFIPNQTSRNHTWFTASSTGDESMRNFYVWTQDPNNWVSVYDGSAWYFNAQRNEHYLHQFRTDQPDLNIRSALVQDELETILTTFLQMGVDGFYIRNSGYLLEDYDMRNDTRGNGTSADTNDYSYYNHIYTYGQTENLHMIARWRALLDDNNNNTARLLMADIRGDIDDVMSYYGRYGRDGTDISLNKYLLRMDGVCDGKCIRTYVDRWMDNLPTGRWANWMTGDENSRRLATRFNANYTRAFIMLTMLLPGTPIIYYGDEINMEDTDLTTTATEAWESRQNWRNLMQWDNTTHRGFCDSCTTWLPVDADTQENNVEFQTNTSNSQLNFVRNLTALRKTDSFRIGEYYPAVRDDQVFSFVREFDGIKGYLVAINFGDVEASRDYSKTHATIQADVTVDLTTGADVSYAVEDEISSSGITLGPNQGIVVSWDYQAKEL